MIISLFYFKVGTMQQVQDLTRQERDRLKNKALDWYNTHEKHVTELIRSGDNDYPPSGSDMLKPELWKPAHWRWFFKE